MKPLILSFFALFNEGPHDALLQGAQDEGWVITLSNLFIPKGLSLNIAELRFLGIPELLVSLDASQEGTKLICVSESRHTSRIPNPSKATQI